MPNTQLRMEDTRPRNVLDQRERISAFRHMNLWFWLIGAWIIFMLIAGFTAIVAWQAHTAHTQTDVTENRSQIEAVKRALPVAVQTRIQTELKGHGN